MERAGLAAAQKARQLLSPEVNPHSILVLVGPGNNGADALIAAMHLASASDSAYKVYVLHHTSQKLPNSAQISESDAVRARAKVCTQLHWLPTHSDIDGAYDLVIDGLFGIGLRSQPLSLLLQRQIEQINALRCPILALDVPSGLSADTGSLLLLTAPEHACAIKATHTLTFIADKPGLHTGYGRDYAGQIVVADLGLLTSDFPVSTVQMSHSELFPKARQSRYHNSHKGSFGTVAIIGGATGMQGAAMLASRSALYAGAGRVLAGFVDSPPPVDPNQPEIMCNAAANIIFTPSTVVVIGPGLGNAISSFDLLSRALLSNCPLVIDADALTLLAHQPALHALCSGRGNVPTILTPHPLEAARLLACTVDEIQSDRIASAKKIALRFNAIVVIKGSGSIIAHPDGQSVINPTGNPGLASAGTGDVLAGLAGALLAQYHDAWQAALAAVFVHGAAADKLVAQGIGPIGLCASDLLVPIRCLLNAGIPPI